MLNVFESVTRRLLEAWKWDEPAERRSAFSCTCGRPVYFRNSICLGCQAPLGYEPESQLVCVLKTTSQPGAWELDIPENGAATWKRCENFDSPAGCNWLVPSDDEEPLCRSCRLNRTIPYLSDPDNCRWWR